MQWKLPFDPSLSAPELAHALIGSELNVRGSGGIIIETEAYTNDDPEFDGRDFGLKMHDNSHYKIIAGSKI